MSAISRRTFVGAAASFGGAALAGCAAPLPPPESWRALALRAATWFGDPHVEGASVIGRHAIRQLGAGRTDLAMELAPTAQLLEEFVPRAHREVYAEAIAADFEARRSIDVGGWRVAMTEVHLCILVALHVSAPTE